MTDPAHDPAPPQLVFRRIRNRGADGSSDGTLKPGEWFVQVGEDYYPLRIVFTQPAVPENKLAAHAPELMDLPDWEPLPIARAGSRVVTMPPEDRHEPNYPRQPPIPDDEPDSECRATYDPKGTFAPGPPIYLDQDDTTDEAHGTVKRKDGAGFPVFLRQGRDTRSVVRYYVVWQSKFHGPYTDYDEAAWNTHRLGGGEIISRTEEVSE